MYVIFAFDVFVEVLHTISTPCSTLIDYMTELMITCKNEGLHELIYTHSVLLTTINVRILEFIH